MYRHKLYALVMMVFAMSCSKEEKAGTGTITVKPHLGDTTSITEPFTTYFDVTAKTSDPKMKFVSGNVYYTTDGSTPTLETSTFVALESVPATNETNDTLALVSNELPDITESVSIKYLAAVQFSQAIEQESMGTKKTTTQLIDAVSEVGSVSYTWQGDTPPPETPVSEPSGADTPTSTVETTTPEPTGPATGTPASIRLSAVPGAETPRSIKCFAILATAVDASGNTIISDQTVTLTLTTLAGSGSFYNNSYCSSVITSTTLASGSSEKYLYYKNNTAETSSVKVVYAGVSSNTYSVVLGIPQVASVALNWAGSPGQCVLAGLTLKDSSGSNMIASTTQDTVVTLTQTSGTTSRFWSGAGCTGSILTTSGVTEFIVPANTVSKTVYFETAVAGTWNFSGSWDSGAASGSGLSAYLNVIY
jgi:hypothetical protein